MPHSRSTPHPTISVGSLSALTLILSISGCEQTQPQSQEPSPSKQFTLQDIRFEERINENVLWRGQAKTGQGTLDETDVTDMVLIRVPQEKQQKEITIYAPQGTLQLDKGIADFTTIRMVDPHGREVRGQQTHYNEKQSKIETEGPLTLQGNGLHATGTHAVFHLDSNQLDLEGPVSGRLIPEMAKANRPASPPQ